MLPQNHTNQYGVYSSASYLLITTCHEQLRTTECSCTRETREKLTLSDHCIPDRMRTESFKYDGGPGGEESEWGIERKKKERIQEDGGSLVCWRKKVWDRKGRIHINNNMRDRTRKRNDEVNWQVIGQGRKDERGKGERRKRGKRDRGTYITAPFSEYACSCVVI